MANLLKQFFNNLQVRKYISLPWLIFYFLIIFILKNKNQIIIFFNSLDKEGWILIKDYLEIILSFPAIILIISLLFIFRFSDSIKVFLENIKSFSVGPVDVTQYSKKNDIDIEKEIQDNLTEKGLTLTLNEEQINNIESHINNLSSEVETKTSELQNKDETIRYLIERAEIYEFAYLNYFLVFNTKSALLWFNNNATLGATQDYFLQVFILTGNILNPLGEKQAIFSTLLANGLIFQDGVLFKITDKGARFLKSIKFIN